MKMCKASVAFPVALRGFPHVNLVLWKSSTASQNNPFVEFLSYWRGKGWERRSINIFWGCSSLLSSRALCSALGCKNSSESLSPAQIKAASVKFLHTHVRRHTDTTLYHKCNGTRAPWTGWLISALRFANLKCHRTTKYKVHTHTFVWLPATISVCFGIAALPKPDKTPKESMDRAGNATCDTNKRATLQFFKCCLHFAWPREWHHGSSQSAASKTPPSPCFPRLES